MNVVDQDDKVQGFFNKQSANWAQTYYSDDGTMKPRIQRFITAITQFTSLENRNLLDIGCGTGELARALSDENATVSACDLSPEMLNEAIKNDVKKSVHWIHSLNDLENTGRIVVSVGDATQDIVTLSSVLEYVLDLPGSLKEIARTLKSGGIVCATVPNPKHPSRAQESFRIAVMQYALLRWAIERIPRMAAYELAYHSRNRMTLEGWRQAYQAAGMKMIEYKEDKEQSLWMIVAQKECDESR